MTETNVKVGDYVKLLKKEEDTFGTIRFIGDVEFATGTWVGIELDKPSGKNDGSVKGFRYFQCEPLFGSFVRPDAVELHERKNGNIENNGSYVEKEKLEKEKIENERIEKERLEKERLEKERIEKERFEKERIEKEHFEKERIEKERIQERIENERIEKEKN